MNEPEAFKQRIRAQWDEVAPRWHRWTPVMQAQYAPATELMLDLARLRPGYRVLDIAAGDGYQSIAAARRVGPTGHVLAVDLAPEQNCGCPQWQKRGGTSGRSIPPWMR
jgi:ubiquinone/menaquinone biosynthesis C-methylase UbiE